MKTMKAKGTNQIKLNGVWQSDMDYELLCKRHLDIKLTKEDVLQIGKEYDTVANGSAQPVYVQNVNGTVHLRLITSGNAFDFGIVEVDIPNG